jgi:hypothetical protein
MSLGAERHRAVAAELVEWWEDVADRGIGSRIVLLGVPAGWGRSTVLDSLAEKTQPEDGDPVTFLFRVDGKMLSGGPGQQAKEVRERLADACAQQPEAQALGLDRPQGLAALGLGVGSLFTSDPGVLIGMLLAQMAVTAVGNVRDTSQAGQVGMLARAARSAAQLSARVPVMALIDDADRLDLDVALVLLESLMFREDGKLLIVAATDPDGQLAKELLAGGRPWTAGRVFAMDLEPEMGVVSRTDLARELCKELDDGLVRRIGRRTATFADVYRVTSADRIAEIGPGTDPAVAQAVVDTAIDMIMRRPEPSASAAVVAWAGGVIHVRQLAKALNVTRQAAHPADRDLDRPGGEQGRVVRLVDIESPQLRRAVAGLPGRAEMAAAVLEEALAIGADPAEPRVERIIAGRAAHRVRGDLAEPDVGRLLRVQRDLAADLEAADDLADAAEVAADALAGCPEGDAHAPARAELAAAVLRLSRAAPSPEQDDLARKLMDEAAAGGAAVGLEARVWAAIDLLGIPDRREEAGRLAEQVAGALDSNDDLGPQATQWRLQLALQAARARRPDITQRLLAPLLANDDGSLRDVMRVLHAADDTHADIRLRIAVLEAELQADDDRLRIHHALADTYDTLGDYRQARDHASHELPLRTHLQGTDHPSTLATRHQLAIYTGNAGDPARARDLLAALLPDRQRVLGPEHRDTLATRYQLATYTGRAGNRAQARDMFAALLPVRQRVLGPEHPDTLATRHQLATQTGETGDPARARDMFAALLPVRQRVLGPEDPATLTTRHQLATFTGRAGDPTGARDMFAALLPVRQRVLGPEHPSTLAVLHQLASSTGEAGDPARARDLFAALLPVLERVLGPEHPATLTARHQLALYTLESGDLAGARDLFAALLPVRERVFGPEHPDTQNTRRVLAYLKRQADEATG